MEKRRSGNVEKEILDDKLSEEDGYVYLWTLIRNISHLLGRARDRELSQYGITVTQSAVLYMINALGDRATPSNIAQVLFREPTTISNTLIRMEKDGLIKRKKDPKRKSQILIKLTKKGEKVFIDCAKRESIKRIMSELPESKHRQIRSLLREVRAAVMQDLGLSPQNPHLPNKNGSVDLVSK